MNVFKKKLDGSESVTTDVILNPIFFQHKRIVKLQGKIWRVNNSIMRRLEGRSPQLIELDVPEVNLFNL